MPRLDTSAVTEDEVKALFNEDGPLEEPLEQENEEATEVEEEVEEAEPAEAESEEEGEEPAQAEEPQAADWDEAPEAYRKEFDHEKSQREHWQKTCSKLQSDLTRRSQAQREEERTMPAIRQKAQYADQWNALLEQNPRLQQMIEREVAALRNPTAMQIPKELQGDPAVKFMQDSFAQILAPLQQRLAQAEAAAGKVNQWESRNTEAANEQKLNGLLDQAGSKIKSMLGRDMTQADKDAVLQYMVDNQYFANGSVVAMEVFGDQYEKNLASRSAKRLQEKAKKFPARSKSVNPGRVAGKSRDAATPEEAISMAMAEQGFGV